MWLGRGQKSAKDYFVADRAIPWWAILFSVVATETSALTFISIPGLAYAADLSFLQVAAGYLLGRITDPATNLALELLRCAFGAILRAARTIDGDHVHATQAGLGVLRDLVLGAVHRPQRDRHGADTEDDHRPGGPLGGVQPQRGQGREGACQQRQPVLQGADVIVVVAGMEGALASAVGGLSTRLNKMRLSRAYQETKSATVRALPRVPFIGRPAFELLGWAKEGFKRSWAKVGFFEDIGITYIGATYLGFVDRITGSGHTVTATLPGSGGLFEGSEVTYRGDFIRLEMDLEP